MARRIVVSLFAAVAGRALASDEGDSPIGKVLSMISDLQAKVVKEGEIAQKEYAEFAEWCEDRARDLSHEIKTGKAEVESLTATIDESKAKIVALTTKVEELAASVSSNDADLKKATEVREKEHTDFAAVEKELLETIDMLQRAQQVLAREAEKGGASMLQTQSTGDLVQALTAMVQASLIDGADAAKLTAFVQSSQKSDDGDNEPNAPQAAAYENKSGNIIDTLQDLQEKAESQLEAARKKETAAANNFQMMELSLKDEIRFAKTDLDAAKKSIAANEETQSTAEGELQATSKELAADVASKAALHHDCMTRAEDFEAETKSRGDELNALATAKQVIAEATGGGEPAESFLQVKRAQLGSDSVVRQVRRLAREQHSAALVQLATRMAAAMRGGSGDPFEKVRGLISDMITKLEDEAEAEATKKAYCDKELKETNEKKGDKTDEIEGLTTKLDQATARSAKLKEEVAALQNELAKLVKSQAEMDKLRMQQNKAFLETKAELEMGLKGLRLALKTLKEYYAQDSADHDKAEGSASGIIGLIEVCESDYSKNLAEVTSEEETAVAEYTEVSNANAIEKAAKEKDVEYKVKESKELDKTAAELTADRSNVQAELDAVLEYLSKIEDECVAKPESYEQRKARREAELAGLKEALQTLESETALVQRGATHHTLRGSARRHAVLKA